MDIFNDDKLAPLRLGCVLDAETTQQELRPSDGAVDIRGYCILLKVPAPFLAALDTPGTSIEQRLDVVIAARSDEHILLLVVQADAVQMRLVMPLGDPGVQEYLQDCAQRGRIRLLLSNEATGKLSILDLPGGFHDPKLALRLIEGARKTPQDTKTLIALGSFLSPLDGAPSLIPGQPVTQAITVLVSKELFDEAARSGTSTLRFIKRPLH
jgi:hypothetical protein